jgi:hypothetical protein
MTQGVGYRYDAIIKEICFLKRQVYTNGRKSFGGLRFYARFNPGSG